MLVLLVVGLMIVGFPTLKDEVTFKYTAFGGNDRIDQILDIHNDGLHAIRPTLEITPLDANHQPIPGVTVTTAFGSGPRAAGDLVASRPSTSCTSKATRAGEVRDVRVRIKHLKQVRYPEMSDEVIVDRYEGGDQESRTSTGSSTRSSSRTPTTTR